MIERGQRKGRGAGFTLVELLAVIAIIITLMGIVLAGAGYAQRASERARAKAQLATLCQAVDMYKVEFGSFPNVMTNAGVWKALTNLVNNLEMTDPWGHPWYYIRDARSGYQIWSNGADGSNGTPDDVSNKMVE